MAKDIHLDGLVLQTETVERVDGLLGVLGSVVIDEAVAQTLPCFKIVKRDKTGLKYAGESSTFIGTYCSPMESFQMGRTFKRDLLSCRG